MSVTHYSRRLARTLLQLDQPLPPFRSESEMLAEVEQNYRWNFNANLLDGVFFWLGNSFISATTILPLFVSKLTTNPLIFALLAVLGYASWYLPQLLTAGFTETLPRKKPMVVNVGFFSERLPVFVLPLAALVSIQSPTLALFLFFVGYAWHGFGAGMISPAWSDMIARCFPVDRRGWFFGVSSFLGTGLGAIGAFLSGHILDAYPFPTNFFYVFLIAAISISLSWIFIAQTREPVEAMPETKYQVEGKFWSKIRVILQKDQNFRRFLAIRLLSTFGLMGAGFVTLAAIQRWEVADSTVAIYTAVLMVGQTLSNLLAGLVADRFGHKFSIQMGFAAAVIAFGLAWLAPTPIWYYPVYFFLGAALGIGIVSGVLIPLEFSDPEHRPTYVGMSNTVMGIGSAAAPLLAGVIAYASYDWLFAGSTVVGVVALLMMVLLVKEPRQEANVEI